MATEPTSQPATCSLDGRAFRIREDEFRELFARALRDVNQDDIYTARFYLDPEHEREIRDLLERESRCCSFFAFQVSVTPTVVTVTVGVPNGSEAALAFLLGLAHPTARANHPTEG